MNLKEVYEAVLIELQKQKAPSMLLDEFNYLYNKSTVQYVNLLYNFCEINQQNSDDLRVLTVSSSISKGTIEDLSGTGDKTFLKLPEDYLHMKSCILSFENTRSGICDADQFYKKGARRLTENQRGQVMTNYYFKPSSKCPYYRELKYSGMETAAGLPVVITLEYGSSQDIILRDVEVVYIKTPTKLELTYEDLEDSTAIIPTLEFPDYAVYEIINILTGLFLERNMDPRLQTNRPINQSIAPPVSSNNK